MKWKNKGHELDKHAEYLVKMFEEKQEKGFHACGTDCGVGNIGDIGGAADSGVDGVY